MARRFQRCLGPITAAVIAMAIAQGELRAQFVPGVPPFFGPPSGVAFDPEPAAVFTGHDLWGTATVSGDRKYVHLGMSARQTAVTSVQNFPVFANGGFVGSVGGGGAANGGGKGGGSAGGGNGGGGNGAAGAVGGAKPAGGSGAGKPARAATAKDEPVADSPAGVITNRRPIDPGIKGPSPTPPDLTSTSGPLGGVLAQPGIVKLATL